MRRLDKLINPHKFSKCVNKMSTLPDISQNSKCYELTLGLRLKY